MKIGHYEKMLIAVGVLLVALLCLVWVWDAINPPRADAAWIEVGFTVPGRLADNGAYCGLPDSTFVDSTGALLLGTPMKRVRMAYLYGYLFTDSGGLKTPPPYRALDSLALDSLDIGRRKIFAFWAPEGKAGNVAVSVANYGMESCIVGGYTWAIPAIDSTASLAGALRHYDLTWKKP